MQCDWGAKNLQNTCGKTFVGLELQKLCPLKVLYYTVYLSMSHHCTALLNVKYKNYIIPHTAGFVYEILICVNHERCHGIAHFNSTVTFNSAIVVGMSQLCSFSVVSYVIKVQTFSESSVIVLVVPSLNTTEQLWILVIATTVQHFNRYSAIKLYRHMHPCKGVIIGI